MPKSDSQSIFRAPPPRPLHFDSMLILLEVANWNLGHLSGSGYLREKFMQYNNYNNGTCVLLVVALVDGIVELVSWNVANSIGMPVKLSTR